MNYRNKRNTQQHINILTNIDQTLYNEQFVKKLGFIETMKKELQQKQTQLKIKPVKECTITKDCFIQMTVQQISDWFKVHEKYKDPKYNSNLIGEEQMKRRLIKAFLQRQDDGQNQEIMNKVLQRIDMINTEELSVIIKNRLIKFFESYSYKQLKIAKDQQDKRTQSMTQNLKYQQELIRKKKEEKSLSQIQRILMAQQTPNEKTSGSLADEITIKPMNTEKFQDEKNFQGSMATTDDPYLFKKSKQNTPVSGTQIFSYTKNLKGGSSNEDSRSPLYKVKSNILDQTTSFSQMSQRKLSFQSKNRNRTPLRQYNEINMKTKEDIQINSNKIQCKPFNGQDLEDMQFESDLSSIQFNHQQSTSSKYGTIEQDKRSSILFQRVYVEEDKQENVVSTQLNFEKMIDQQYQNHLGKSIIDNIQQTDYQLENFVSFSAKSHTEQIQ